MIDPQPAAVIAERRQLRARYAQLTVNADGTALWTSSTSDLGALQKSFLGGRCRN